MGDPPAVPCLSVSLASTVPVYSAQHPKRSFFRLSRSLWRLHNRILCLCSWFSFKLFVLKIKKIKKNEKKTGLHPSPLLAGERGGSQPFPSLTWGPEMPTACLRSHRSVGAGTLALDSSSSALHLPGFRASCPLPAPAFALPVSVLSAWGEQRK